MPAMSSEEKKADIARYHKEQQARAEKERHMDSGVVMDSKAILIPGGSNKAMAILSNLGPGEPYFILRAQDILSIFAIEAYAVLVEKYGGQTEQMESLTKVREEFLNWQRANPGKVKLPD